MSQNRISGSPVTITSDSLVIEAPLANRGLYFSSESLTGATPRSLAIGSQAGQALSTGADNTFLGYNCGQFNSTGTRNTFVGSQAGNASVSASESTFIGHQAGALHTGGGNTAIGNTALYRGSGTNNTVIGANAALVATTAGSNSILGNGVAAALTSGQRNIIIGQVGGSNQGAQTLTTGTDNIIIGSDVPTGATAAGIYIGRAGAQTSCSVAGITGVNQTGPNVAVTVNGSGQLGIGAVSLRARKDDIESIDEVVNHEKLMQVKPRNYTFKDWSEKVLQHGVIIDEIKPIYPELVGQCGGEDFYVNYEQFIALLIADVQYAWKSMHNLEFRLTALENKTT